MNFRRWIKAVLRHYGFELVSYDARNHHLIRRRLLFQHYQIDLVLDVGASDGGYGRAIRANGYNKRIVSFEPRKAAFLELIAVAERDAAWKAMQCAVGNSNGTVTIHTAANSDSSSLLPLALNAERYSAGLHYVGQEEVAITTLDAVFEQVRLESKNILLKIDAQGFERSVLEGAHDSLQFIDTIQLELSLTPVYQGQIPFHEMGAFLHQLGYTMVSIEPGFHEEQTGRLFEVDGIFHRYRGPTHHSS